MLLLRVRLSPVIGTRDAWGNAADTMGTETQYKNERRVGGWRESFWTDADGRALWPQQAGHLTVMTLAYAA